MEKRRYIVLKEEGGHARVLTSRINRLEALQGIEVGAEVSDLTQAELQEVRKDPAILRTAPVMPVKLVRAKATKKAEPAAAGTATWGVEAVGAVTSQFTGAGVTVAVLDTGIDAKHEAFKKSKVVQKDFTEEGDGDGDGHGTHCAGTLFGGEVAGLRIGVAPGVEKALIGKVLDKDGSGTTEQIMDGILWAVREGANIVSMSIGFDFSTMVRELMDDEGLALEPATSQALTAYRDNVRLFDSLADLVRAHSAMFSNAILIAAAGNESDRPNYEIATSPPAAADGFVSVGALERRGGPGSKLDVAYFSNSAPVIAGPGVAIRSAKPGGGLVSLDGTSMATPHVAGVAALWLEQIQSMNAKANIRQLEGRLVGTASLEHIASDADLANVGVGMVQAPQK